MSCGRPLARKANAPVPRDAAPARERRPPATGSAWRAFALGSRSPPAVVAPERDAYFRRPDRDVAAADRLEREADRLADAVTRGARASVRAATAGPGGEAPAADAWAGRRAQQALAARGEPLPAATRAFMEGRFGRDFSAVRVHLGSAAQDAAAALGARAFTVGTDVACAGGEYAPGSESGRRLLAHELAHVVQRPRGAGGAAAVMRQAAPGALPLVPQPAAPGIGGATTSEELANEPKDFQDVYRTTHGTNAEHKFRELGSRRSDLVAIYNRLTRLGLWSRVRAIPWVGERERSFWGGLEAPGATVAVGFATDGAPRDLVAAALGTMRMCADTPLGGSQHPDQVSMREVTSGDGLHLSVGPHLLAQRPGDPWSRFPVRFDAHLDRYSPVRGGGGSVCAYDVVAGAGHIGRELVPSKVRKWTRIPGVQLFPEWEGAAPRPDVGRGAAGGPPPLAGMTWRFPGL